jgi:hypothetical protein
MHGLVSGLQKSYKGGGIVFKNDVASALNLWTLKLKGFWKNTNIVYYLENMK